MLHLSLQYHEILFTSFYSTLYLGFLMKILWNLKFLSQLQN